MFLSLFATLIMFAACEKEEAEGGVADRLFRPTIKGSLEAPGNYINASWQKIEGAVSYTLQLSRDTFKTIDLTTTVDTNAVTLNNLSWNKLYQLQVKANASDSTKSSKMGSLGSVKTAKFPSILKTPSSSDVTDEALKVSWTTGGAAVTSIKVLKGTDSSLVKEVALSATNIADEYRIISGLTGSTSYIVYLYSGTTIRGWEDYITKPPYTGKIIDLRNIEGRPSVLADTIPIIESGSLVLLKRGETYTISSTLSLNKSISITSGNDLLVPSQAVISMPANFNITSGSVIDSIIFNDITLRGTDYASKYVFNINTACTIGKISFESCRAEIFRGVLRTQSQPAILGTFQVINSVLDSLAGYGVITIDVASSKVDNIIIQRSTIYKAEKVITSRNNSLSVLIEDCTINEAPWAGNYLVDYSTSPNNNVANGVTINRCLFGIGKDKVGDRTIRGYRTGGTTSVVVTNSYKTSDQVVSANELPDLNVYAGTSTTLWEDPFNGNFKVIDNTFSARSSTGDPRWRP